MPAARPSSFGLGGKLSLNLTQKALTLFQQPHDRTASTTSTAAATQQTTTPTGSSRLRPTSENAVLKPGKTTASQSIPPGTNHFSMGLPFTAVHIAVGLVWSIVLIGCARLQHGWLRKPQARRLLDRLTGTVIAAFGTAWPSATESPLADGF